MLDPYKIRNDFPMYRNKIKMQGKDLVWLDNASTTFKPDCVLEAVSRYYTKETSNSHRGDYDLCFNMDMEVLNARRTVAKFINSKDTEVVFTSGTTASINLVAFGYGVKYLTKNDKILLTQAEHASNVLPWYKVSEMTGCQVDFIPLDKDGRLTPENLEKALTPDVKLVCVAHVTNVLGYIAPIKELAAIAHKHGALIVVDGAQSVPHIKMDVKDSDIDFLSFSGHKMCGPTGIGVLYGKFDLLSKMEPFMTGGGMNAKFDMCGDVNYLEPPLRFEAGTQNLEGIIGLHAAIDYLTSIGLDNIEKHEEELKKYCVEKLKATGKCTIYNEKSEGGIVTFNVNNVFAQDAATYLNSRGIACRSGQHCAKILIDFLGTIATIRASFYLYTTKEDIDALVDAVSTCEGDYLNAYFN
ncbi:MAG: cysteine desulfurase [Bacillales bacterium]|nr:cysteine desulfurase [Mollicutes bacterium]MCI7057498.1 cysteine desulfurase [Mollicutes bacterium]MCI7213346.1 cysteine desulfurase [Bacillales bacterium]MDD7714675.1 cysteine desulfurase [Mollicutes bacterium]MDY3903616.1 cysteine desulfurase [Candidatus Enteromonas sp.]